MFVKVPDSRGVVHAEVHVADVPRSTGPVLADDVMNGVDHPDGYTDTLTMGHGFAFTPVMPGCSYRASFTLIP